MTPWYGLRVQYTTTVYEWVGPRSERCYVLDLCLLLIAIIYLFFLQCTPLIVEYYGTRHSWTHADSTGSYDLEFAASVALGLDSRSRASLPLCSRARVQPSCHLAAPSRSTTLVPWSPRAMVLSIVPESALVRVQVPYTSSCQEAKPSSHACQFNPCYHFCRRILLHINWRVMKY